MKNLIKVVSIFYAVQFSIYGQCTDGYTYFDSLPASIHIINGDSCFYDLDLQALDELIAINDLNYQSPLEVGTQTWVNNRLRILVAGNYGNSTGVNDTIFYLPESIGNWLELRSLYLEWNDIYFLPESFGDLVNLQSLFISNNNLQELPGNFGDLQNLYLLDAGYNQLDSLPDSFCNLTNLTYLWLFNNELTTVPACICSLSLNWSGIDAAWYPYFAIGGNRLCENVPECAANSEHFHTSLDQFYYSFMITDSQDCDINSILNENLPSVFQLYQPFPNPFNPTTTIRFSIPVETSRQVGTASLQIFDITGAQVETLVEGNLQSGEHEIVWDAAKQPSGVYFVRLISGEWVETRKLILLK